MCAGAARPISWRWPLAGCTDLGNNKTDCNNHGGISTDMVGGSWSWPDASYQERLRLFEAHKEYTLGLLHFMGHDPASPASLQVFRSMASLFFGQRKTFGRS